MWSGFWRDCPLRTLSTTVCTTGRPQLDFDSPTFVRNEKNVCERDVDVLHGNNSEGVYGCVNEEDWANTRTWPPTFPVSDLTGEFEEEAVLIRSGFPLVKEKMMSVMEEREVALWCPQNETRWLQEESECSQRSVASGRTHMTTTGIQLSDPGAPTKRSREKNYICSESDELSASLLKPALYQHLDFSHISNNSVSLVCESSAPSRITPLEEAGESVDLTNHFSHLVIASSPARKRLFFTSAVEDSVDTSQCDVGVSRPTQMHIPQRGKRTLEELDMSRDAATSNSSVVAVLHETYRKCRRVDAGEGVKSDSTVCLADQDYRGR